MDDKTLPQRLRWIADAPALEGLHRASRVSATCMEAADALAGFTWDDVDRLRYVANDEGLSWDGLSEESCRVLNEIANRIAALLPPRENAAS